MTIERRIEQRSLGITEISRLTGVSEKTIRRLEMRGIISCVRDGNGYRRFPPRVVTFLRLHYKRNVPTEHVEPTVFEELTFGTRSDVMVGTEGDDDVEYVQYVPKAKVSD